MTGNRWKAKVEVGCDKHICSFFFTFKAEIKPASNVRIEDRNNNQNFPLARPSYASDSP